VFAIISPMAQTPTPIGDVQEQLRRAGYLADTATGTVVHLAQALSKPVLIEGPAGTGKTQLAKSVAVMTGKPLIRLQCYEGLDESKAIYEWDYRRQLLQLQLQQGGGASADNNAGDGLTAAGIFGEDFLLSRPLLAAIRSEQPVVLLIDEVDRLDMEAEALLLEVLSEYQVSIPELGTVTARHIPQVFLTSNNTRDLSEALKRRCLYLHLGYPSMQREAEIVQLHVPELSDHLASEVASLVAVLRGADLKKPPSISETVDWARTLLALGAGELSDEMTRQTLSVLLKYERDITLALAELSLA
jgi:MoxR-like ATPase